jgi:hypothetical protein
MPVVNEDWLDPSSWAGGGVSWGVIRDGDTLRFARAVRNGSVEEYHVPVSEWLQGCSLRSRVNGETEKGGRLVAGLSPARVMLRALHSPIADPQKSSEIWPSLLDAALPFALEDCMVAFGEALPAEEGGLRCLAAAIRLEDLEAECGAWRELGLDPDSLVPEALVIAEGTPGVKVWTGTGRSVFVHWSEKGFSACGGAKDPSRDGKTLTRFLAAFPENASLEWVGPEGDDHEDLLERGLALAGLGQGGPIMNLRAEPLAHPALSRRARVLRSRLMVLCAGLGLLAAAMPLLLRSMVNRHFDLAQERMAEEYRRVTGMPIPPGPQRLHMERWIDQEWGGIREASEQIFSPGVRAGMGEVLSVSSRLGLTVREWMQDRDRLRMIFSADRGVAERMVLQLGDFGWRGELEDLGEGTWLYRGEKTL